jgi:hypothetical protein
MNLAEKANNLIFRAKNISEFTVVTQLPEGFQFTGRVPFDIDIYDNTLEAKVWAMDFDEAVEILNEYLESCK